MDSTEIGSQINAAVAEMEQINNSPEGDNGDLSTDQAERFRSLKDSVAQWKKDKQKAEDKEYVEREKAELRAARPLSVAPTVIVRGRDPETERKEALRTWALCGTNGHRPDADAIHRAAQSGIVAQAGTLDYRALSKGTAGAGGYTVPTGFVPELEKKLKYYCNFREFCRVFPTADGTDYQWPVADNTGNTGGIKAEAAALDVTGADPTFTQVTLKAFKFVTPVVKVSTELLQDSAVDIETELVDMLGEHLGREMALQYATGDGTTEPEAITTGLSVGTNLLTGNALTWDKLVDLKMSVDRKYRDSPKCGWLMHDTTFAAVLKLASDENVPLFMQNLAGGSYQTLLGQPIYICNDLTSIASPGDNAPLIIYGDFSKYVIRDVQSSMKLIRFDELYMGNDQVGFAIKMRSDGRYINKSALKTLNSFDAA